MSLPRLFGTELHTIPLSLPVPSWPLSSARRIAHVVNPPGGISVGVVWASNPDNKAMYRNKSMPLAVLMPLVRTVD